MEKLVAAFKQAAFVRKSEKADSERFDLALEDLKTAIAAVHAGDEADSPSDKLHPKPRAANRGSLRAHRSRVEEIIEPESLACPCGGGVHRVGEDVSERLDVIPAQLRVIRHPKSQICLPRLHRRRISGSSTCSTDPRRIPDRGDHRACTGVKVSRSSQS